MKSAEEKIRASALICCLRARVAADCRHKTREVRRDFIHSCYGVVKRCDLTVDACKLTAEIFDEPEGAASVARIGDVAVATAKDGLHYFLYDHERGKWVQLGEMPGAPPVEFALKKSVLGGWHIHPDMLPSQIVEQGEPTGDGWGMKAAQLLDDFGREVTEAGLFAEPFFALAAYRLADGSHILPSPPVLMTPNSGVPIVSGSADFSVATMKMSVAAAVCALQWRVKPQESLSRWAGVISHLDIFISRPVSLSAPGGMRALHRTECKNFTHCIDADAHAGEHRVWSDTIVQGWAPASC